MELEYDVVVIGAGPGGSVAAKYAAKSGCSTLMIEKRQEIGTPVRCGEGIAKRWLDDVGIEPSKKWIAAGWLQCCWALSRAGSRPGYSCLPWISGSGARA